MTTDGLFDDESVWRPILEQGFGAVDMEAAGRGAGVRGGRRALVGLPRHQ